MTQQQKKQCNGFEAFDWNSMVSQMMDFNKIKSEASRNMEAAVNANQIMLETAQTIGRKAYQAMQEAGERNMAAVRDAMSMKSMEDAQKRSSDMIRESIKSASDSAAEMMKLSSAAALELTEIMNKRMSDSSK